MTLNKGKIIQVCFAHDSALIGAFISFSCLDNPLPIVPETTCNENTWYTMNIPCSVANGMQDFTIQDAGLNVILTGVANIQ